MSVSQTPKSKQTKEQFHDELVEAAECELERVQATQEEERAVFHSRMHYAMQMIGDLKDQIEDLKEVNSSLRVKLAELEIELFGRDREWHVAK